MPQQILQVDQAMLEATLDRMVRKSVEETLNAMPDASGRRDHRRRALRAQRGPQGVSGRPLRTGPDRQGRQDEPQSAEAEGRGVLLGGDRTLPTQGGERRGGLDRHVPGRRLHASGRRCQPAIVGRPHALADPERQAQARLCGHRRVARDRPLEQEYAYLFMDGVWHKRCRGARWRTRASWPPSASAPTAGAR